jgi:GTPase SAR1 family protein
VIKVIVIGDPQSGKTSLCAWLYNKLAEAGADPFLFKSKQSDKKFDWTGYKIDIWDESGFTPFVAEKNREINEQKLEISSLRQIVIKQEKELNLLRIANKNLNDAILY